MRLRPGIDMVLILIAVFVLTLALRLAQEAIWPNMPTLIYPQRHIEAPV